MLSIRREPITNCCDFMSKRMELFPYYLEGTVHFAVVVVKQILRHSFVLESETVALSNGQTSVE